MAVFYVRSTDGSDVDDGSTWALAKATLAGAFTAASAGDTIYVSDNHAETQASSMTLTSPGTAASPVQVICVDDAAEPPTAKATTGTVTTTGNTNISFVGFAYCYGLTFSAGSGNSANAFIGFISQSPWFWSLQSCALRTASTNASAVLAFGAGFASSNDEGRIELVNTTVQFGATGQMMSLRHCHMIWSSTASAITGATLPTTLLQPLGALSSACAFEGYALDLSALGSGKNIINAAGATHSRVRLRNCKLGSSVSITTGTVPTQGGIVIEVVNCDSADTNYRYHYQDYAGTITQETTIVRTGGASDGTTPIAYKFVTTANSKWYYPLRGPWATLWNETTGSGVTLTAEVVTDNVTLTDAEAWIEVEHLGTSGFPLSLIESDQITDPIFGTPANQTSSSVTWTTTGLGTPVKQKLSKQVTPQEKGPIRARVVLAKASTTMYADLKLLA